MLAGLGSCGLDLDVPDNDVWATPEAVLWFNLAQKPNANDDPEPWGVLVWDEAPPGLVRVVVPAKIVADLETHAQGHQW